MATVADRPRQVDDKVLLGKALFKAADALGISKTDVAGIVGRDRSGITRDGIDPKSKSGELALIFIRIYRGLYARLDGDPANMKHWIHAENTYFAKSPRKALDSCQGLVDVAMYIDGMRGKI